MSTFLGRTPILGPPAVASRTGTGAIFYWFADQLGSTRTITTGSGPGQTPGQLCYDADFTPYGQEISYTGNLQTTACAPNYKFTGYERDPETTHGNTDTGLDYAFARFYSSRLGRFLSTDPLGGSIGSLQSHNAYAYTLNNPLNLTDPSGLCPDPTHPRCKISGNGGNTFFSWLVGNEFAAIYNLNFTGYYLQGFLTLNGIPVLLPDTVWVSNSFSADYWDVPIYSVSITLLMPVDLPQTDNRTNRLNTSVSTLTPAEAATKYCEDHGQIASTLRGTDIPITASGSFTVGPVNYNTKNEITPVIPAFPYPEWLSFGAGVDVGINVPQGSAPSWSVGLGKNLGISFYPNGNGTTGVNLNIGLSIGPPLTVSPGSANACGLRAGGS